MTMMWNEDKYNSLFIVQWVKCFYQPQVLEAFSIGFCEIDKFIMFLFCSVQFSSEDGKQNIGFGGRMCVLCVCNLIERKDGKLEIFSFIPGRIVC